MRAAMTAVYSSSLTGTTVYLIIMVIGLVAILVAILNKKFRKK